MIAFIEGYLIKLTMIAEQQTYKELLNNMKRSARETVNWVLEELIFGSTATPVTLLTLDDFVLATPGEDSFYGDFIGTPVGKLLHAFCLQPEILSVIAPADQVGVSAPPKTVLFDHLLSPDMRAALIDKRKVFGLETDFTSDELSVLFEEGKSLKSTKYVHFERGNPSIFKGIGKKEGAMKFSLDLINTILDILDQTRDLCKIHQFVQQSLGGVGLLGDFFIRSCEFNLLMMAIQEVSTHLAANLLASCNKFYATLQLLPVLIRGDKNQYQRIILNHASIREIHRQTQAHITALGSDARQLQKRSESITLEKIEEAVITLTRVAEGFCHLGEKIGLRDTQTIRAIKGLLDRRGPSLIGPLPSMMQSKKEIKDAVEPSVSFAAPHTRRAGGSFRTITLNGVAYDINIRYEYEDQDIDTILKTRLAEWKATVGVGSDVPVYAMAPVQHTIAVRELQARLKSDHDDPARFGKRILLIPCNVGGYHWVGLLFEFDETNACIRAEFLNSTSSGVPDTLNADLKAIYPGVEKFTPRLDLISQGMDGTSCGACAVENLFLRLQKVEAVPRVSMFQIRAQHLDLLRRGIDFPALTEAGEALDVRGVARLKKTRAEFFTNFAERQLLNKLTFDSRQYPSLKKGAPKSEKEVIAIAEIASLILMLDTAIQAELRAAMNFDEDHAIVLTRIRNVLWDHGDLSGVENLSLRLFATTKQGYATKTIYQEQSTLIFEYEYLRDIAVVIQSAPEEVHDMAGKRKAPDPETSSQSGSTLPTPSTRRGSTTSDDESKHSSWSKGVKALFASRPADEMDTVLPHMNSSQKRLFEILLHNKDRLRNHIGAMRAAMREPPRGSVKSQAAKRAFAKFVLATESINRKRTSGTKLQPKHFTECSFDELQKLTALLLGIYRASVEDKANLKILLEFDLDLYFDRNEADGKFVLTLRTTAVEEAKPLIPVEVEIHEDGLPGLGTLDEEESLDDAESMHESRKRVLSGEEGSDMPQMPSILHASDPTSSPVVTSPAETQQIIQTSPKMAEIDLDGVVKEAVDKYVSRGTGRSLPASAQLRIALAEVKNKTASRQTALIIKYILSGESGTRCDAPSIRVKMLAKICAQEGMYPLIRPNHAVSKSRIFMALCDYILFSMAMSPLEKNDADPEKRALIDFLMLFIETNLKYAVAYHPFINPGILIKVVVQKMIDAPIEIASTPSTLREVLRERKVSCGLILEALQYQIKKESNRPKDSKFSLSQFLEEAEKGWDSESMPHGDSIYSLMVAHQKVFFKTAAMMEVFLGKIQTVEAERVVSSPIFGRLWSSSPKGIEKSAVTIAPPHSTPPHDVEGVVLDDAPEVLPEKKASMPFWKRLSSWGKRVEEAEAAAAALEEEGYESGGTRTTMSGAGSFASTQQWL